MKVYIVTIAAARQEHRSIAAGARTSLTIQPSHEAAYAEGIRIAEDAYSLEKGWKGYKVDVFELPQGVETDGYRMTWNIESVSGAQ